MAVDVIGLDFAYKAQQEQRIIFSGATASFSPGRFYALMGPSGSGKTVKSWLVVYLCSRIMIVILWFRY
ncbi:hypothetical protein [Actinotignum schaalii]|uniref:ABC transporter domain-containing protein n=1 Tax=Actinotignum schaalii FB123-CNA-2 TaxID=883067 RepID=S2VQB2_9ACTO|nr:hypothetical protein [Actinotignum schaalii]EPD28210.1 hypothetical protein HMPREF9237_00296 [Actinotignum schaalii FB123-CNA-2]